MGAGVTRCRSFNGVQAVGVIGVVVDASKGADYSAYRVTVGGDN